MKEFVAGTLSGVSSLVVGQPFDVIKVQIQTKPYICPNVNTTISHILKNNGYIGLWRGIMAPIYGVGVLSGTCFGLYSKSFSYLEKKTKISPLSNSFVSGCNVGIVTSVIITPSELIKTKMQTSYEYKGVLDVVKKVFKSQGVKGLFRGFNSMLIRDGVGYGFYFASYHYLKEKFGTSNFALLNAGGIAGTVS